MYSHTVANNMKKKSSQECNPSITVLKLCNLITIHYFWIISIPNTCKQRQDELNDNEFHFIFCLLVKHLDTCVFGVTPNQTDAVRLVLMSCVCMCMTTD